MSDFEKTLQYLEDIYMNKKAKDHQAWLKAGREMRAMRKAAQIMWKLEPIIKEQSK